MWQNQTSWIQKLHRIRQIFLGFPISNIHLSSSSYTPIIGFKTHFTAAYEMAGDDKYSIQKFQIKVNVEKC